jgi:hypothetical protein
VRADSACGACRGACRRRRAWNDGNEARDQATTCVSIWWCESRELLPESTVRCCLRTAEAVVPWAVCVGVDEVTEGKIEMQLRFNYLCCFETDTGESAEGR